MTTGLLNWVITLSIIVITGISLKDRYFPKKTDSIRAPVANTQITPPSTDPEAPCTHPYFNFKKGSSWRYKLDVTTQDTSKFSSSFFTMKVAEVHPSSIILTTQFDGAKEVFTSSLLCKRSGAYGFPFPLSSSLIGDLTGGLNQLIDISSFERTLQLLPPTQIGKGGKWENTFGIASLLYTVTDIVAQTNASRMNINVDIVFSDNTLQSFNSFADNIANYQLTEGIGVSSFKLKFDTDEKNTIQIETNLVEFVEG